MTPDYDMLREVAEAATPGPWTENLSSAYPITIRDLTLHRVAEAYYRANSRYIAAASPATILSLLDALKAATERAERAERERDEANAAYAAALAEVSDALGNIPHKTMASAIAYVRGTVRERDEARSKLDAALQEVEDQRLEKEMAEKQRDEARAERDARPEITPEDAWMQLSDENAPFEVWNDAVCRVNEALRTHAAKAKVTT